MFGIVSDMYVITVSLNFVSMALKLIYMFQTFTQHRISVVLGKSPQITNVIKKRVLKTIVEEKRKPNLDKEHYFLLLIVKCFVCCMIQKFVAQLKKVLCCAFLVLTVFEINFTTTSNSIQADMKFSGIGFFYQNTGK